jgi:hypothetical protein
MDTIHPKANATPTHAFCASVLWTASQLVFFFRDCDDPQSAARAHLRRRENEGLVRSAVVDAYPTPELTKPLHIHRPGRPAPDFDKLAYVLEKRWAVPAATIRVYFPTRIFARLHGTWTGCDTIPEPNKASHNLLVSSVWLIYLQRCPELALYHWTAERRLQFEHRRGRHLGPIPDGLIRGDRHTTAVEVGGRYPAAAIRRHAKRFSNARCSRGPWHWVLW